ncbi:MAG TPA: SGNH/GDSL hydrolase family protein, partial [Accumulibacter sp.]|nr:SGNH/GDSL hydrolase family protein [Accumulibacter sp.]
MKTLQYWGTGNFQEHPYTGRIVTWTEKEKQTVDDAIAAKLLAANAGFVLDNDSTGEVVTSQINSVTGGIALSAAGQTLNTTLRKNRKTLLVGDSIAQFFLDSAPSVTAIVDNGNGTATATFSGSHNYYVGSEIFVNSAPQSKFNTFGSLVTAQQNSNPYTVTYALSSRNSPVTGANDAATLCYYMKRYSCLGGASWFEFFAGDKINWTLACAGGAESTQALTMLNDALSLGEIYDDVIVCCGMNDIYAHGNSYATNQTNLAALLVKAANTGARLWTLLVPPRNSADAIWSAGKQTIHNQTNKWLWEYTRSLGGTPIDLWRATHNGSTWINSGATNPDPTTGFTSSSDYTHPLNIGASAMGLAISSVFSANGPRSFVGSHGGITGQGNLFANPKLTGTGGTKTAGSGTINGTVPDSWTVEITWGTPTVTLTSPARTVSADGDADGNNLQAVFAWSGSGTQVFRLINTTSLHGSVTPGTRYRVKFPVTITGASGMTGMECVLFGANPTNGNTNIGTLLGTSQAMAGSFSGAFVIPDWVAPSGMTSLSAYARFYFNSGGATIVFGKPTFEPVI